MGRGARRTWRRLPIQRSSSDDIGLQVVDAEGTIVYDDSWPAAAMVGSTQGSSEPSSHSLISSAPTDAATSVTRDITLTDGTVVGQVRLWVFGSDALLSKADTAFRDRTFNAMFLAWIVAVAISVIIGILVSRMLTNPLRRITGTAKQIHDGDLSARTGLKGDDEIDRLGETFDEMATSLERDLKHERRIPRMLRTSCARRLWRCLLRSRPCKTECFPPTTSTWETGAAVNPPPLPSRSADARPFAHGSRTAPLKLERIDTVSFVRRIVDSQQQLFTITTCACASRTIRKGAPRISRPIPTWSRRRWSTS